MKIFYLSAIVSVENLPGSSCDGQVPVLCVAHFYVRAEQDLDAGACAQDMCRAMNMQFLHYLDLPAEESESTLHSSDEHGIAYGRAKEAGQSVVLSIVYDSNSRNIDPSSFLV